MQTSYIPVPMESHEASKEKSWLMRKKWRPGILRGAILATCVFVVNLIITIVALSRSKTSEAGQKAVYEGNCNRVKQLDTYLHLAINILSTILLGASNFAMQCSSAPTREDDDRAHEKRDWLDIGILSFRNLPKVNSRRTLLWSFLMISSLPYNSTIYSSIYSADYGVFVTTGDVLSTNAPSTTLGIDPNNPWLNDSQTDVGYYWDVGGGAMTSNYNLVNVCSALCASAISDGLLRLNTSECITKYATTFPTNQGILILVTQNSTWIPYVYVYQPMDPIQDMGNGCPARAFDWICNQLSVPDGGCMFHKSCAQRLSELDSNDWRPFGKKIDYCLSQPDEEKCTLSLNSPLIIVVIVFNLAKAVLLVYTAKVVKDEPLITIGDSIASFLQKTDKTTKRMCLMDRKGVNEWQQEKSYSNLLEPRTYAAHQRNWSSTVSVGRWCFLFALCFSMLTICIILFVHGITGRYVSTSTLLKLTPGTLDPNVFSQGWSVPSFGVSGLLSNVFIANSLQILLSMIYFTYNSLFTSCLLGAEWNSFAPERKGLRVSSNPTGEQRATYFLQLPTRWAAALMISSAVLHWLCSQSIFLVIIEFDRMVTQEMDPAGSLICSGAADNINTDLTECFDRYVTCGYNPLSILTTCILGVLMVILVIAIAFKKYDIAGMPAAGTCSASISASCQLLQIEDDDAGGSIRSSSTTVGKEAATSKLQWGEIDTPLVPKGAVINVQEVLTDEIYSGMDVNEGQHIHHCGFSHQEVTTPRIGWLYAGQ